MGELLPAQAGSGAESHRTYNYSTEAKDSSYRQAGTHTHTTLSIWFSHILSTHTHTYCVHRGAQAINVTEGAQGVCFH